MNRALVLAALVACGSSGASTDEATSEVRAFFAAADAGDCATIRLKLPSLKSETECTEYVASWRESGTRLVSIVEAKRDGRDRNAIIIRAVVRKDGREREILVRAVHGDRWTLVF